VIRVPRHFEPHAFALPFLDSGDHAPRPWLASYPELI
jgi:hypothetical protein